MGYHAKSFNNLIRCVVKWKEHENNRYIRFFFVVHKM